MQQEGGRKMFFYVFFAFLLSSYGGRANQLSRHTADKFAAAAIHL